MIAYENQCVGCPTNMGCIGDSCKYRNVSVMYCDKCGKEIHESYSFQSGEMFCENCFEQDLNDLYNSMSFQDKMDMFIENGERIYKEGVD